MMLPEAVRAGLAQMRAEARKAGYAEGYAHGEAAGREAERAALIAALAAEVLEDRQRDGVASPANTGAPGPSPVAVAGVLPQALGLPLGVPAPAADAVGVGLAQPWATAGRAAMMRAEWPGKMPTLALQAAIAALPGPPVPRTNSWVYRWAHALALGPREALGGKSQPRSRGLAPAWRTAAREALLRELWPQTAVTMEQLRGRIAALPGALLPTSMNGVYAWASGLRLGARTASDAAAVLKAKPGPQASEGWRTMGRAAVLEREWPAGTPVREIRALLEALPGPPLSSNPDAVGIWASQRGLSRPAGFPPSRMRSPRGVAESWGGMLAWADTVDPDMVLRGSPEERLAQINDLRALEGLPLYRMPDVVAGAGVRASGAGDGDTSGARAAA